MPNAWGDPLPPHGERGELLMMMMMMSVIGNAKGNAIGSAMQNPIGRTIGTNMGPIVSIGGQWGRQCKGPIGIII